MTKGVNFPGYYAKVPARKAGARTALRRLKRAIYGAMLFPYGVRKHKRLLETCDRTSHHTYTCFLRAPAQLSAITGPVLDFLGAPQRTGRPIEILMFACSNGAEAFTLASWLTLNVPALRFHITASDLHQEMVDRCLAAEYSADEALQSEYITTEFVDATFERRGERYVVKQHIRDKVSFFQANILESNRPSERFVPADIVTAQNVLFHLSPANARIAFANAVSYLKPTGVLLAEGMDTDLRVELTQHHSLQPLVFDLKTIYSETRIHTPQDWWNYYWGTEPYFPLRREKERRYGTIFLRGRPALGSGVDSA
jgi:chemotaxis protein methyltransferase CheR